MVYCAVKLIKNLKLFFKALDHTFYGFTSVITHLGCWENTRKACKSLTRVLPTSRVGYRAGKPIESVFYFLNILIHWIMMYPFNSATKRLNSLALEGKLMEAYEWSSYGDSFSFHFSS